MRGGMMVVVVVVVIADIRCHGSSSEQELHTHDTPVKKHHNISRKNACFV
jgi:hypothetical protein